MGGYIIAHIRAIPHDSEDIKMTLLKIEFHVSNDFTATIRKGHEVKIEWEKLPPESRKYVMEYGMQRVINDSVGRAGKREAYAGTDEEFLAMQVAMGEKKLAELYAGEIKTKGKAQDEVGQEYRKLVIAYLKTRKDWPRDTKSQTELFTKFTASMNPKVLDLMKEFRAKAEEIVASRAESIDLADDIEL